jgi:hypothetical protein
MHGRVDVHISASLHTTQRAFLLDQTRHCPNDAHLLLHCEPHSLRHHWYGCWLVWWNSIIIAAAAAAALSSDELVIINGDGKTGIKCSAQSLFVLQNYIHHGKGILFLYIIKKFFW